MTSFTLGDPVRDLRRVACRHAAFSEFLKLRFKLVQLFLCRIFEIREYVARLAATYELIQLQMDRLCVPVLRRLDEKTPYKTSRRWSLC